MCVEYFLVLLDVTIVNVALPSIGTGLHTDVSSLQWVVDGYALALASLMLPAGALGDRQGHWWLVLAGLAAFGIGSLACGLAPRAGALVAARAVQGVGAASLLPGTLAMVGLALLAPAHPSSSYAAILLPAFLAWGIGLGILTPAVVAAAVAATPGDRAGLASAVNNTARQAGGAIGVAVAGAVAGSPSTAAFVSRMHTVAAGAAVLFVVLAIVIALLKYQGSSTNSAEP